MIRNIVPLLTQKISLIKKEQVYEVLHDIIIYFHSYLPVFHHFPRVPTRIVGKAIFNSQSQWCECVDRKDIEIEWF